MLRVPFRALASMHELGKLATQDLFATSSNHEVSNSVFQPHKQAMLSSLNGSGKYCPRSLNLTSVAPAGNLERNGTWREPSFQTEGRRRMSGNSKDSEPQNSGSNEKKSWSEYSNTSGESDESRMEVDAQRMVDFTSGRMLHRAEGLKGVARRVAESKEVPPDNSHPVIVYSSSIFWADSTIGGILRSVAAAGTWIQSYLLCRFIDKDFNLDEFMEGCKDASFMVNQLFGEKAWDTLGKMVSTKLLNSFKEVSKEFDQQGLNFSMTTEQIRGSYIQSVNVCDEDLITKFDKTLSSKSTEDSTDENSLDRFWIMIGVRILSKERLKVWKCDGEVVSDTLSQRNDLWVFARGPFHNVPMIREESNDLQWMLISVG